MTFKGMTPLLQVLDLKETLAFYTDVLGFEVVGTFPDTGEPFWASVRAGDAQIMFNYVAPHTHDDGETHQPEALFNGGLYFYPDELEDLHATVKAKVANCSDIRDTPYGMREFTVHDPNGYDLTFGVPDA